MIYRRKCDLKKTSIEGYMDGKGAVWTEKLLLGPKEMRGKRGACIRHALNRGVLIGTHARENEMETMATVKGKALYTINGRERYLEEGDIIAIQPGDIHEISQAGEEPLVLIAQVLFV